MRDGLLESGQQRILCLSNRSEGIFRLIYCRAGWPCHIYSPGIRSHYKTARIWRSLDDGTLEMHRNIIFWYYLTTSGMLMHFVLTSKHNCWVCNVIVVCEETCKEFWETFRTNEDVAEVTCRVVYGNFTLKATNKWISYTARQWKNFISPVRCLISMPENPGLCWEVISLLPFRAALV